MRRLAAFLLAFTLLVSSLCGCTPSGQHDPAPRSVSCEDLTITIPGHFRDCSKESFAQGLPFVYGYEDCAVLGIREPRAQLDPYLEQCSAAAYAELFLQINHTPVPVTEQDGLVTFTYTAETQGIGITYLCAAYMGQTNYWIIQTYCASADFADLQSEFMEILRSVQV